MCVACFSVWVVLWLVVLCALCVACCVMRVVHFLLFVVLCFTRRVLCVVCCFLFVACCGLRCVVVLCVWYNIQGCPNGVPTASHGSPKDMLGAL